VYLILTLATGGATESTGSRESGREPETA
jgi:hypothetical protein